MATITLIAAIGDNNCLGKDNKLLWHIPEDLKFFKEHTIGKQIILGRKTLESLPGLLPKRKHLVLTHQDLPENEEFPNPIVRDQGIWSLICKEMNVSE